MKKSEIIFLITGILLLGTTVSLNHGMCIEKSDFFTDKIISHSNVEYSLTEIVCTPDFQEGKKGTMIVISLVTVMSFSIMIFLYFIIKHRKKLNIEVHIRNFCDLESDKRMRLFVTYVILSVLITTPTVIVLLSYSTGQFISATGINEILNIDIESEDIASSFLIDNFGYPAFMMLAFVSIWLFLLRLVRKHSRDEKEPEKNEKYPGTGFFVKYFYAIHFFAFPGLLFPGFAPLQLYDYRLHSLEASAIIAGLAFLAGSVIFGMEQFLSRHMKSN